MLNDDDEYFSKEKEVYKEFIKQIDEGLKTNKNVWVDQTTLNKSARNKLLNSIHIKPDGITIFYIKVSIETAIARNNKRTGRALVPEDVIRNMYASIEEPIENEYIHYIVIEND